MPPVPAAAHHQPTSSDVEALFGLLDLSGLACPVWCGGGLRTLYRGQAALQCGRRPLAMRTGFVTSVQASVERVLLGGVVRPAAAHLPAGLPSADLPAAAVPGLVDLEVGASVTVVAFASPDCFVIQECSLATQVTERNEISRP